MPRTGAFDAVVIWHRLVTPPGAYALVLAPGRTMTRYQIPSLASSPGQASVPAAIAAGTFDPFSSSAWFLCSGFGSI